MIAPPTPYRDARIRLRDGRRLAFAEFGDPDGRTVFWFHGTPGARWQIPPDAPSAARARGFRIVGVDRPGIGGSSHHSTRTLLTWADDIAELADQLGARRFATIGLSGGGPYVLSCAHELPDRVAVGVSLGGVGPTDGSDGAPGYGPKMSAALRSVWPVRGPLGTLLSMIVQPIRPFVSPGFDLYVMYGPQEDRRVFERPEMKEMFSADIVMATRYGLRGPVYDLALFGRPWGFSPRDIRVPIRIWHGDADTIVPISHSEHLASVLPDAEMHVSPGLGHFAGFCNMPAVLDAIRDVWPAEAQGDQRAVARSLPAM